MKFSTFTKLTASVALALTMCTSCDRYYDHWCYPDYPDRPGGGGDRVVTVVLDGCWRGYTHWFNWWDGHNYTKSEIEFIPRSNTYGTGYWVDFYDAFPSDFYIFNDIEWEVYNGDVLVHFLQEDSYVTIYSYTLNNYYFKGFIDDNGQKVEFCLDRISRPYYNWDWFVPFGEEASYAPSSKSTTDSLSLKRNEMMKSDLASGKLTINRGSTTMAK